MSTLKKRLTAFQVWFAHIPQYIVAKLIDLPLSELSSVLRCPILLSPHACALIFCTTFSQLWNIFVIHTPPLSCEVCILCIGTLVVFISLTMVTLSPIFCCTLTVSSSNSSSTQSLGELVHNHLGELVHNHHNTLIMTTNCCRIDFEEIAVAPNAQISICNYSNTFTIFNFMTLKHTHTHTHTQTQNNYSNPCASVPNVNYMR